MDKESSYNLFNISLHGSNHLAEGFASFAFVVVGSNVSHQTT